MMMALMSYIMASAFGVVLKSIAKWLSPFTSPYRRRKDAGNLDSDASFGSGNC